MGTFAFACSLRNADGQIFWDTMWLVALEKYYRIHLRRKPSALKIRLLSQTTFSSLHVALPIFMGTSAFACSLRNADGQIFWDTMWLVALEKYYRIHLQRKPAAHKIRVLSHTSLSERQVL